MVNVYSGTTSTSYNFFFRTNLQGDVVTIYNGSTNAQVVSFNYDAWGAYTTNIHNSTLSQIALNILWKITLTTTLNLKQD